MRCTLEPLRFKVTKCMVTKVIKKVVTKHWKSCGKSPKELPDYLKKHDYRCRCMLSVINRNIKLVFASMFW